MALIIRQPLTSSQANVAGPDNNHIQPQAHLLMPSTASEQALTLQQVLNLAKRGMRVFPLSPSSKIPPSGFKWQELATNDKQQIVEWSKQYSACNWAARTGPDSGVFVLDVDGVAGRISLNSFVNEECVLPNTLTTQTGKTLGCHLWFEYPNDGTLIQNSAGKLAHGLDIRGKGGYVVIPPSIHPNGTPYTFINEANEILRAPEWLLQLIKLPEHEGLRQFRAESGIDIIPVGRRNDTLFRDACALRRRRATQNEIMAFLAETNRRCERPLEQEELIRIARSAYSYAPARRTNSQRREFSLARAAFYGVAGKVVDAIMPHTEADEAALLVHLLAGFGNVIGRHAYCVADGARHFTNLFVAFVGATAKGRKGTSWNRTRGVLELVDSEWAKDRIQSGLSSGEGLVAAAASKGVTTSEAGTPIADGRLLVVQSELASVLRVMGREGNTLSATIRDAWDTGAFQVMVKKQPMKVDDAHISIVGHITCEELRRYLNLTESGNGFANRFLWVQSGRSKCLPEGGTLTVGEITELADLLKPAVNFGHNAGLIQRNSEAKEAWATIYPELSEGHSGLFGAVTSRAEAQVLRLSLIYAVLDCSAEIRQEHLEAALAVWLYCEQTAQWIFGTRLGDSTADEILAVLRTRSEGMTRNQLMNHFGRHKSSEDIRRALGQLQNGGHAHFETCKTAGRRAQVWIADGADESLDGIEDQGARAMLPLDELSN